jgi:hypothetical protein
VDKSLPKTRPKISTKTAFWWTKKLPETEDENVAKNAIFGDKILPQNEWQIRPPMALNNTSERVHVWNEVAGMGGINRCNNTKGQKAMAVAMMFPDKQQGKKTTSQLNWEVHSEYLRKARTVIAEDQPLARFVLAINPSKARQYPSRRAPSRQAPERDEQ